MVDIPLPVTFIQDYIKNWKKSEEGILVYPKHRECDELILRPHFTFLSGEPLGWEFIATLKIVPPKKMNKELVKLYKYLKTVECELNWYGLIRRKHKFEIINSNGNPELALILNSNGNLSRTLNAVDLKELRVILFPSQRKASEENVVKSSESYNEPREITWVIMAMKTFMLPIERLNRIKCRRDFISTFKVLSEVSKSVKTWSFDKLKSAHE